MLPPIRQESYHAFNSQVTSSIKNVRRPGNEDNKANKILFSLPLRFLYIGRFYEPICHQTFLTIKNVHENNALALEFIRAFVT